MLNRDLRAKINQAAHSAALLHADGLRRQWTAHVEALLRARTPYREVEALTAPKPAGDP